MSKYIKEVLRLSEEFTNIRGGVSINKDNAVPLIDAVKELPSSSGTWGYPRVIKEWFVSDFQSKRLVVLYELMASSINYCYWYGRADVRPNDAGATTMYSILDSAFEQTFERHSNDPNPFDKDMPYNYNCFDILHVLELFRKEICKSRMPMLKERLDHIDQLIKVEKDSHEVTIFVEFIVGDFEKGDGLTIDEWFDYIFVRFPGFAEDMFLKRLFLFFMQVNRRIGIFDSIIGEFPVPSDYQVPKILNYFNVLEYPNTLGEEIRLGWIIPRGSAKECSIRGATILACKYIADEAGCTSDTVDNYLWLKRKECKDPFHLTITTDY